jgi:hypothetical protein
VHVPEQRLAERARYLNIPNEAGKVRRSRHDDRPQVSRKVHQIARCRGIADAGNGHVLLFLHDCRKRCG